MNVKKILNHSVDFGSRKSRNNICSFTLKILFYIIPAVILGHFTDRMINIVEDHKMFGDNLFHYIFLQTVLIISTFYILIVLLKRFVSEFQTTIPGTFFVVVYWGMQTNYIIMLKKLMDSLA